MAQVSCGQVPEPDTPQEGLVYVALQELATRIAHHNTGKLVDDPVGYEVMKRVASDENRHHLFYRDLCTAALEIDPSGMVDRHRAPGARVRDAGHRHRRLRDPRPGDRQGRHLRLPDPPRADPGAGGPAPLGRRGPDRAVDAGRARPATRSVKRIDRIGKAGRRLRPPPAPSADGRGRRGRPSRSTGARTRLTSAPAGGRPARSAPWSWWSRGRWCLRGRAGCRRTPRPA